ncbi:MAG: DVU0298 family protein [Desulfococcaceae bacterium]
MSSTADKPGNRELRRQVGELLRETDYRGKLRSMDFHRVVGPLFSHFYAPDELLKWRAVVGMGIVVAERAEGGDKESARVVMRRFMWNLNDESGGIGWGCPEAMGEAAARSEILAEEFHSILASYAWEEGNYLEHPRLQYGVLWGIGRLAHARPELIPYAAPWMVPFTRSEDANHRGLAAWALGPLDAPDTKSALRNLSEDDAEIRRFDPNADQLVDTTVGELARAALARRED